MIEKLIDEMMNQIMRKMAQSVESVLPLFEVADDGYAMFIMLKEKATDLSTLQAVGTPQQFILMFTKALREHPQMAAIIATAMAGLYKEEKFYNEFNKTRDKLAESNEKMKYADDVLKDIFGNK